MAQRVKRLPAVQVDLGLIPGSGRPSGEGNGNPLQYSCLDNSLDRRAAGEGRRQKVRAAGGG